MTIDALTEKWVYMEAMQFGCYSVYQEARRMRNLTHEEEIAIERKVGWEQLQRDIYQFALDNWKEVLTFSTPGGRSLGQSGPDSMFCVGYRRSLTYTGIQAWNNTKTLFMTITWTEIKKFIKSLLVEDRQVNMWQLLTEAAISNGGGK